MLYLHEVSKIFWFAVGRRNVNTYFCNFVFTCESSWSEVLKLKNFFVQSFESTFQSAFLYIFKYGNKSATSSTWIEDKGHNECVQNFCLRKWVYEDAEENLWKIMPRIFWVWDLKSVNVPQWIRRRKVLGFRVFLSKLGSCVGWVRTGMQVGRGCSFLQKGSGPVGRLQLGRTLGERQGNTIISFHLSRWIASVTQSMFVVPRKLPSETPTKSCCRKCGQSYRVACILVLFLRIVNKMPSVRQRVRTAVRKLWLPTPCRINERLQQWTRVTAQFSRGNCSAHVAHTSILLFMLF